MIRDSIWRAVGEKLAVPRVESWYKITNLTRKPPTSNAMKCETVLSVIVRGESRDLAESKESSG